MLFKIVVYMTITSEKGREDSYKFQLLKQVIDDFRKNLIVALCEIFEMFCVARN